MTNKKVVYERDETTGLIKNVDYIYHEDGSVDWRSMVKPDFLFPNKSWFEQRKQPMPKNINGLSDHQLLIKLAGIKDLAKLRGYSSVKYEIVKSDIDYVVVKCGIQWIANFEMPFISYYEDMANATVKNTSSFALKFLETIAANRAFVRAVRNFLNIYIVGLDEIDTSNNEKIDESDSQTVNSFVLPSPQKKLEETLKNKGINSFKDFKQELRDLYSSNQYKPTEDPKKWAQYSDIPSKEARRIISLFNKTH